MLITLSCCTAICQSVAEVWLIGVTPLEAVCHRLNYFFYLMYIYVYTYIKLMLFLKESTRPTQKMAFGINHLLLLGLISRCECQISCLSSLVHPLTFLKHISKLPIT